MVGIDYNCRDKKIYWTDLAGRTINRASLEPGAEPETVVNTGGFERREFKLKKLNFNSIPFSHSELKFIYYSLSQERMFYEQKQQLSNEISAGLTIPEGLAVDAFRSTMFWVDSGLDKIETSNLDGSRRRVLFDTELVNPRAIIVDSTSGYVLLNCSLQKNLILTPKI